MMFCQVSCGRILLSNDASGISESAGSKITTCKRALLRFNYKINGFRILDF